MKIIIIIKKKLKKQILNQTEFNYIFYLVFMLKEEGSTLENNSNSKWFYLFIDFFFIWNIIFYLFILQFIH